MSLSKKKRSSTFTIGSSIIQILVAFQVFQCPPLTLTKWELHSFRLTQWNLKTLMSHLLLESYRLFKEILQLPQGSLKMAFVRTRWITLSGISMVPLKQITLKLRMQSSSIIRHLTWDLTMYVLLPTLASLIETLVSTRRACLTSWTLCCSTLRRSTSGVTSEAVLSRWADLI